MMYSGYDVLLVQGKIENLRDGNEFARLLGETLGSDAERYFRENWLIFEDYDPERTDAAFKNRCDGECDRTYGLQEHYENLLRDIKDHLKMLLEQKTKHSRELQADLIMNLINSNL